MHGRIRARWLRAGLALYFAVLATVIGRYLLHNVHHSNGWSVQEWLINYSGGFIRRGLLGQIFLYGNRLLHLPLAWQVTVAQAACVAVVFALVWWLARDLRWSWAWVALLLSPATFAFPVLDPPATLKKEFLLFAALALLIWHVRRSGRVTLATGAVLAVVATCLTLTHEAMVLFLPYLFVPVFLVERDARRALRLVALPALLAVVAAWAAAKHPGNAASARAICSSIGGVWDPTPDANCGGAIGYLRFTPEQAKAQTTDFIRVFHYARLYAVDGLLACLPLAAIVWRLLREGRRRREMAIVGLAAAICVPASAFLFIIATDWGRWIEMHVVCLLLLLLVVDRRGTEYAAEDGLAWNPRAFVWAGLTAAYATCWTLPAVGMYQGRWGYRDLVKYVRTYSQGHPAPDSTT